jgi:hypothetical protein
MMPLSGITHSKISKKDVNIKIALLYLIDVMRFTYFVDPEFSIQYLQPFRPAQKHGNVKTKRPIPAHSHFLSLSRISRWPVFSQHDA